MNELLIAFVILTLWAIGYFIWREYLRSRPFKWPNLGTREHPINVRIERKVQYSSTTWKFHVFNVEIWHDPDDHIPAFDEMNLKKVHARLLGEFNSPVRTFILGEPFFEDSAEHGMLWEVRLAHQLIKSTLEDSGLDYIGHGNDLLKFDL